MPDILRETISATEVSALFDASPYVTKWMLFRRFAHGESIDDKENNRMSWGKRMEPLCLEAAAEDLRFEVRPNRGPDGNQAYIRSGLLGCTRDAQIICPDRGPGALETKVVFDYATWMREWDGGKTVPRHHEIQNQVQMFVGDGPGAPYKWGVISAWVGGEQHYFERKPIPELWAAMEAEAARFFEDVKAKREPAAFGAPVEAPLLTKVFPTIEDKVLDLRGDGADLTLAEQARMMQWHGQERLGHEKAEKAIKAKFQAMAEGAEKILLPRGIEVKVATIKRAGYTVKPSSYQTISVHVPADVGEGQIDDAI